MSLYSLIVSGNSLIELILARPQKISDDVILDAARELFIKLGLKATTAQIAEKAGVSEGLLFKRFGCKNALFLASIGLSMPSWFSEISDNFTGQAETRLIEIATKMISLLKRLLPKVEILVAQNPQHQFPKDAPPVVALIQLEAFFKKLEGHGYRSEHPQVLARIFMGSIHHFVFSNLKGIDAFCPCREELYVKEVVGMILNSMDKVSKDEK